VNAVGFEQIGVHAAALYAGSSRRPGHLLAIDGRVRKITTIDHVDGQVWILHEDAVVRDAPFDELTVSPGDVVPCVRRADWLTALDDEAATTIPDGIR
jgi:hypothetical protein